MLQNLLVASFSRRELLTGIVQIIETFMVENSYRSPDEIDFHDSKLERYSLPTIFRVSLRTTFDLKYISMFTLF